MGFLSNLFGDTANPDLIHQNLTDIVCLSIAVDGELAEEERVLALDFTSRLLGVDKERAAEYVSDAFMRLSTMTLEDGLAKAASQLHKEEHRQAAFLAAAWVQYADGEVRPEEDGLLLMLAELLEIEDEEAQEMLDYVEANLDAE